MKDDDGIEITTETKLPKALEKIRRQWIEDAKKLNGWCFSLICYTEDGRITFKYQDITYFITQNSFGMDYDAFQCNAFMIEEDLSNVGCELLGARSEK